jgi:hypothetical protein
LAIAAIARTKDSSTRSGHESLSLVLGFVERGHGLLVVNVLRGLEVECNRRTNETTAMAEKDTNKIQKDDIEHADTV